MTSRDLDEAVARLRAASLRNDPLARDPTIDESAADLGPPRGRPDGAGQPAIDPAITEARGQIGQGPMVRLDAMPVGAVVPPPRREPTFAAAPPDGHGAATPFAAPDVSAERRARFGRREEPPSPLELSGEDERRGPGAAATLVAIGARVQAFLSTQVSALAARRRAALAEKEAQAAQARQSDAPSETLEYDAEAVDEFSGEDAPRRGRLASQRSARQAPLTERERRWQRRRRRYVTEEILGWILVPIIIVAVYFGVTGILAAFGYTIDDLVEGARMLMQALG